MHDGDCFYQKTEKVYFNKIFVCLYQKIVVDVDVMLAL